MLKTSLFLANKIYATSSIGGPHSDRLIGPKNSYSRICIGIKFDNIPSFFSDDDKNIIEDKVHFMVFYGLWYDHDPLNNRAKFTINQLVDKSKKINLDRFIYALGIRHIGLENAKLLSQHLKSVKNFYEMTKNFNFNTLSNIDGIGETQIKSIKNFFSDNINLSVINELKSLLVITNNTQSVEGIFKNKIFMFTGKLVDISRAEAKSLVEKNAGKIASNVNKRLDYLVIGKNPTNKKVIQAKELNIKVIDQKEWKNMLN